LRIGLVEVREQGGVGEVLEARCVVGHDIGGSGEERGEMAVAVQTLVSTGYGAETRSRAQGGYGSFGYSGHGWGVVREVHDGGVTQIGHEGHGTELRQKAGVFEVAVCHRAGGMGRRDQAALDLVWEGMPPEVRGGVRREEDPTHALFGGVRGAEENRVLGHYLGQVGRAVT